jgi:hypothetical protein
MLIGVCLLALIVLGGVGLVVARQRTAALERELAEANVQHALARARLQTINQELPK